MRGVLLLPAIFFILLFMRNKDVADLIDTGDWSHALIYIAFAFVGVICLILSDTFGTSKEPKE